ncbi:MAG: hypothetical protein ABI165_20310 [Bryobacteraceae bacterium]
MRRVLLIFIAALQLTAANAKKLEQVLDQIAKTATVMIDGDVCQKIVTPRAMEYMFRKDPRDPWVGGDNYDVDDASFIQVKKILIRLAQLADYPVDVNLWMPLGGNPPRVHVAIRNRYEMSQFWVWGALTQEMFPEMRTVLRTGKRVTVERKRGFVSVLAPVRNSLDDIVGLVEVVSRTEPDARENVK